MSPRTLQRLRVAHRWLGVFFAPLIVLFAITGVLQTLGIDDWPLPEWVHSLNDSLEDAHQDQRLRHGTSLRLGATVLIVVMGIALALTTLLGLFIGFRMQPRRRRWGMAAVLILGVVLPAVMLWV